MRKCRTIQTCVEVSKCRTIHTYLNFFLYISILVLYANHFWLDEIVLKLSGDIEQNPGPKPSPTKVSLFVTGT